MTQWNRLHSLLHTYTPTNGHLVEIHPLQMGENIMNHSLGYVEPLKKEIIYIQKYILKRYII